MQMDIWKFKHAFDNLLNIKTFVMGLSYIEQNKAVLFCRIKKGKVATVC